jgi:multidrug efflux pump subunit AcrA (membrane-fusion protein)
MEQELENKTDDFGDEAIKKRKRKQRIGMLAIILILAAISAGCITVFIRTRKSDDNMSNLGFGQRNDGFGGESIVTATGTTSVGIDAVTFDIDFLEDTSLYVEEVYLESGDEVEAGTKYLKLTDSSIEEARKELKSTLLNAQLEYRSGVISNHESQISAKYDYDLAILEANQAQGVYDDTLASLQVQLDKAKEAYDDANEDYNELYYAIENDTFYEDYNVAALKQAYDDAYDLYYAMLEDWDLSEDDVENSNSGTSGTVGARGMTISGAVGGDDNGEDDENDGNDDDGGNDNDGGNDDDGGNDNDGGNGGSNDNSGNDNKTPDNGEMPSNGEGGGGQGAMGANGTANTVNWNLKAAQVLKAEMDESEEEYEQALSDYEDARDSAELNIQQLFLDLETAREDYEDAQLRFQKQSQSAKTQYETAVVKGETAQLDYETQLTSLEEQLDKLKDAKDEAQDNLATFEATVGDGYLYTEEAGTILMVMTKADNALTGGEMLFAYSNPDKISVSVSVSQDYIAQLYVGENATVIIDEYGQYTGTVQTINPVSSSDNRTSVYYTVTVLLDAEDISGLSANLTATVMFGDVEMPEDMGNDQQNGEMPEGMGDQQNGDKPQDMDNNQQNGEMPQGMGDNQQNGEMPQGMGNDQNMNDKPQGGKNE